MTLSKETIDMAKYIWSIIENGGSVAMSWGIDFDSVTPVKTDEGMGMQFHVQGFKMTGIVEVIYDEGPDYFIVNLIPDGKPENRKSIKDVCFDQLVDIIDNNVEYTGDDYEERVNQQIYNL